ncbi:hypothetical protein IF2G_06085 [Cordyceps javanica]|nr:hypothetical protein IF2G_06085 [Cordyceps javanica]
MAWGRPSDRDVVARGARILEFPNRHPSHGVAQTLMAAQPSRLDNDHAMHTTNACT